MTECLAHGRAQVGLLIPALVKHIPERPNAFESHATDLEGGTFGRLNPAYDINGDRVVIGTVGVWELFGSHLWGRLQYQEPTRIFYVNTTLTSRQTDAKA